MLRDAWKLTTTNETPDYPFWTRTINIPIQSITNTNNVATPKQICFEMPLYDDGTAVPSATGNKVGASAKPNLGLLSSGPMFDDTSVASQPVQNSFNNPILGIDVELVRTDANATTFVVTEVVLESEKRLHFPYARSVFEACWPAYALQTVGGTLAVQNEITAVTNAGPLVGVRNDTGSTAGAGISTITGFIPRDARAQTSPSGAVAGTYSLRVDGKFSGPTNVAAPNNEVLGLKFYVKEVEAGSDWNKTIASATPDVAGTVVPCLDPNTVFGPPVLSTAASEEIANTSHVVEFSSPTNDDVIGWWFTVTRETAGAAPPVLPWAGGVYSGDINGAELFYLMTNVQLQGSFNDESRLNNTYIAENIYEQHVLPTALIDDTAAAFVPGADGDIAGFNFPNGGNDIAYFTTALDYRYDDKSGLIVEIITAATASGGDVIFNLEFLYSDCGDAVPVVTTSTHTLGDVSVNNNTAFLSPANNVRFLRHKFLVPPQAIWSDKNTPALTYGSPDATAGANKGTVRWKIKRQDAEAYDVICLGVTVASDKSNKTSLATVQPANINEDYATASSFAVEARYGGAYVPSYPFLNYNAITNVSIQRFTWQFVSPAAWLPTPAGRLAAGAEGTLVPAGFGPYDFAVTGGYSTAVFGQYIPYSFAITDIYGYCVQPNGGRTAADGLIGGEGGTSQIAVDFRIMEVPQASGSAAVTPGTINLQDQIVGMGHDAAAGMANVIVFPGVQGFPLTIYPNSVGNIRWNRLQVWLIG